MVQAEKALNYDGIFVYRDGYKIESMRVIHRADRDGERERLVALTGVAREVIRDPIRVTCILPDEESVRIGKRRPRTFRTSADFADDSRWQPYYSLSFSGTDRVAGRPAEVVVIRPKDNHRYGYRLGIDRATGLLLKSELLDGDGTTLEQIVYTSISIPEHIPDELLEPGISGAGFTWHRDDGTPPASPSSATSAWQVRWLPSGFRMSDHGRRFVPSGPRPVEHWMYSDGLASMSIFVENLSPGDRHLSGLSSMGAVNAFGKAVDRYQVTVVGEVPAGTVQAVAASILRVPE